jgi:DNA polymerase-3 subunit delta
LKLTSDSLTTHLAQRLLPAYLISGDEPLLAGEAADAVRERARAAGFTEREVHFVERAADWDDVRASAASLSLFAAKRLLEIRLPSARIGAAGATALRELLRAPSTDTLFLVLTPRLDREAQGADWVRELEARGGWVQVWPVPPERLVAWLRGRARKLGLEASEEAFAELAARTEGNLLAAQQELMQLVLLSPGGRLSEQGVVADVADRARFDVFQLGEAALSGETSRALRVLYALRAEGTEATLTLWALTRAMRDLWGSREGTANLPSWQRRSTALAQAARRALGMPFAALAARASGADRVIKGRVPGNTWDELTLLTAEICGVRTVGTGSASTGTAPVRPAPVRPAAVSPAPVGPAPAGTAPVGTAPAGTAPVGTAPGRSP